MNRRDFITNGLRMLFLIMLGAVSAIALTRKGDEEDKDCLAGSLCRSCQKARGCSLPQKS